MDNANRTIEEIESEPRSVKGLRDHLSGILDPLIVKTEADEIADAVIKRLAAEGYDAFRPGSYHDVSPFVRKAIAEEIVRRKRLNT